MGSMSTLTGRQAGLVYSTNTPPPPTPLQAPKGPDPEVPMPRRSEPELPQFPPDVS